MQQFGRRFLIAVLALAALSGTAGAELAGSEAPDFVLKAASGKNHRLSEYRGQVVLVAFWASWCGECRSQLEGLAGLHERYAGADLQMLAVSLDRERSQVIAAAQALGVGFPALHDAGGEVGEQYDVDNLPYVVLVDRDGLVRFEFTGYRRGEEDAYLERVRELLSE
ncbi:MAG TPA: TlpA disulfide reductase family protein [Gammaproteobacteria bacterium]|nr:TlpA disulfide reductase family protein [Gammaproteobacteria bacterium]